jgi:hypothetical protein
MENLKGCKKRAGKLNLETQRTISFPKDIIIATGHSEIP